MVNKRTHVTKKVAAFALAILLCLTLLPSTALAATSTLLSLSSPGTAVVGQEVMLTATLNAIGIPLENQTVEFYEGGASLGTATTNSSGTAVWTYTPTAVGSFTLEAKFAGDSSYDGSSDTDSLTVGKAATATALTCGPVKAGQPVTLTTTVSPVSPSAVAPTSGDVDFYINGSLVETVSLNNSNEAVCTATAPAVSESFNIMAIYAGNSDYIDSTALVLSPTVEKATPSVSSVGTLYRSVGGNTDLTLNPTLSGAYGSLDLTMTISGGGNPVSVDEGGSNGPVNFLFAAAQMGTLLQGTYNITVSFGGDANNEAFSISVGTLHILPREATPNISIDYINETLDGFIAGEPYTLNGGAITPSGTTYPIDESWMGSNQYIVKQGDLINTYDSEPQTLPISARPAAPNATGTDETAAGANDGEITGLDGTKQYEYKPSTQTNYTSVPANSTEITGLAPGTYDVRLKATTSDFASAVKNIIIGVFIPPTSAVNSVTISPKTATVHKGGQKQFTAIIDVQGGASTDVTWSVDSTLSTVDQNGLLSVGQYETADKLTVTAESALDNTKKGTATVTVTQYGEPHPVRRGFDLFQGSGTVSATIDAPHSKFLRLLVEGTVLDSAYYTVTEGSTIITLHESYLKTLANGEYQVLAIFTDGQADMLLTVDMQEPTSTPSPSPTPDNTVYVTGVKLDKSTAKVTVGKTLQLTATVSPDNATDKGVTWESSDTGIATVDENGLVKGVKAGKATITVTTDDGGYTATCEMTVTDAAGLPQTGDNGNMMLWMITGLTSILAGLCALIWRKQQQLNENV